MVRNIMGTLVSIGSGDQQESWLQTVLEACDRKQGGIAAPPHGLTLVSVAYPDEYSLPVEPNSAAGVCCGLF